MRVAVVNLDAVASYLLHDKHKAREAIQLVMGGLEDTMSFRNYFLILLRFVTFHLDSEDSEAEARRLVSHQRLVRLVEGLRAQDDLDAHMARTLLRGLNGAEEGMVTDVTDVLQAVVNAYADENLERYSSSSVEACTNL